MESEIDGYLAKCKEFSRRVPDDYGATLECLVYPGSPTD